MREITAYISIDGSIHEDERDAVNRDIDLIGTDLDYLLTNVLLIDRSSKLQKRMIDLISNDRKTLASAIAQLHNKLQS